jgi:hypothetical protein
MNTASGRNIGNTSKKCRSDESSASANVGMLAIYSMNDMANMTPQTTKSTRDRFRMNLLARNPFIIFIT